MQKIVVFTSLLLLMFLLTLPASLSGQQISSAPVTPLLGSAAVTPPTDQIIIKFADATAENWLLNNNLEGALPQLSAAAGIVDTYRALQALNVNPDRVAYLLYLPAVLKSEPPPPPPPLPPIVNPGFESGATGWAQYSSHGWPIIINSGFPPGVTPHGGSWLAWLGGDSDDISYVQQQVVVPPSAPYLTYWRWIASADVCGYDFAGLVVNGTPVDVYTLCQSANTGGWSPRSVNLSAYAGQTITFQLRVETDDTLNSNLFVDDFAFTPVSLSSDPVWGNPALDTAAPRAAVPAR